MSAPRETPPAPSLGEIAELLEQDIIPTWQRSFSNSPHNDYQNRVLAKLRAAASRVRAVAQERAAMLDLLGDALRFVDGVALADAHYGEQNDPAIILGDRIRAALSRSEPGDRRGDAWKAYAKHLQWCGDCGDNQTAHQCATASRLRAEAERFETAAALSRPESDQ